MVETENPRDLGGELRDRARSLKEGKWLILLCVLLATGAAVLYSTLATPKYESTSRLLVNRDDVGNALGLGVSQSNDPVRESATDIELASSPTLAGRVVKQLRLPESPEKLLEGVTPEAQGNSNLIVITVSDTSKTRAARIANAFADQYVALRAESDQRRVRKALAGVRRQITIANQRGGNPLRRRRLESQAEELELLNSLQTGGVEVIQRARPAAVASSPKPARSIALGVFFGLLLGIGLAALRGKLDRRVKREEDVRSVLPDVPIIATLPASSQSRTDMAREVEGFRNLQTNVGFLDDSGSLRSLLVTSPTLGDGKSTTSLNLALAMGERDKNVILMEADLRRRGLTERLGLDGHPGLSNLLSGGGSMEDYLEDLSISGYTVKGGMNGRGGPSVALSGIVTLLPAGPRPPNPQALLSGPGLDELLSQATTRADKVIIDGTPVGPVSDMLPVARRVDGVVLVVRLYHSRRDELQRLKDQFDNAGVRPIGIVLFEVETPVRTYEPHSRS